MAILERNFYLRENVVEIASELIGKRLVTKVNNITTSGIITETEAYAGETDRASHAWNGRKTHRTKIMYRAGGTAYVYFCYGMHYLFNIVTNREEIPHAVLIRAIVPDDGIDEILRRRGISVKFQQLTNGPGKVAKALGIDDHLNGKELFGPEVWLEESGLKIVKSEIRTTPRIGVDYAGADALLPYRFVFSGSINFDRPEGI